MLNISTFLLGFSFFGDGGFMIYPLIWIFPSSFIVYTNFSIVFLLGVFRIVFLGYLPIYVQPLNVQHFFAKYLFMFEKNEV
jgi:hypothetical protein